MSLSSELEVTLSAGPYNDLVISVSVISPKAGEPAEASQNLITDYWSFFREKRGIGKRELVG
jgi:hypothetical protein